MVQAAAAADRSRTSGPTHLAHVEGLRAIAAYVVFVNHAYATTWNPGRGDLPPTFLSFFTYSLVAGHLSVSVFIVISGFCLMLPVVKAGNRLRGGTVGFFKRRARRILPPYYGAVAFCLALIWTVLGKGTGTIWDVPILVKDHLDAIVDHLLLVQDLFGTSKINYVFWSIAVEWQIYFLFPLLVAAWRRYGAAVTVGAAMAFGYLVRFGGAHTRIGRAAPHYIGLFALGMLAAYLVQTDDNAAARVRERLRWGWACVASFALACVLSRLWGWRSSIIQIHLLDLPIGIGTFCLLVTTSRDKSGLVTRLLSAKPLVFVGTFSYSVYLIHAPLIQFVWQYLLGPVQSSPVATFAALMGPGTLFVLAASYGFFRVFEEPFMRQSVARRRAASPIGGQAATLVSDQPPP
jgi:peptidoglycan/LPS O-acetylase OafA/YrhL